MAMEILSHPVKLGMTWDEIQPLFAKGIRESLFKPDENEWELTFRFPGVKTTLFFKFRREGTSPYRLIDWH